MCILKPGIIHEHGNSILLVTPFIFIHIYKRRNLGSLGPFLQLLTLNMWYLIFVGYDDKFWVKIFS